MVRSFFEHTKKYTDISNSEIEDEVSEKCNSREICSETFEEKIRDYEQKTKSGGKELIKKQISSFSTKQGKHKLDNRGTIDNFIENLDEDGKNWFHEVLNSGVGGIDGWKVHLKGKGEYYFMTSDSSSCDNPENLASGNFLSTIYPGNSMKKRAENLQLPPGNDGGNVSVVESTKAAVVMESKIAPQKEWANECGYEAKEGITQIFTLNHDKKGALHAGIYKEVSKDNVNKDEL